MDEPEKSGGDSEASRRATPSERSGDHSKEVLFVRREAARVPRALSTNRAACVHSSNAYARLDRLHVEVAALEREMGALHESASLFEVNTPDYRQLKACRRREVGQLKQLWDVVKLVHSSIEEWKTTLWRQVKVETMDIDLKKFVKDIRALDKEMRAWDAFSGVDSTVNDLNAIKKNIRLAVDKNSSYLSLTELAFRDMKWFGLVKTTPLIPMTFSMTFSMTSGVPSDLLARVWGNEKWTNLADGV
ncbi:dynein beta chain, ciliary-like [Oscarella lobularis]|uniref:dynein beta chain, ciliary-like n=1 Tax=Oscarella lobularis TaxID=121494 RepID=UPI003313F927